ncbi:MAG: T9SS type A sorting domain-containing protein, partial [Bacteroidetes bacterium]|nr:T9SS type A sorting domain-containing protein [Bacteroidota bacterium]
VGIKENNLNQINLSVYPNPANSILNIESPLSPKGGTIKIVDVLGKEMLNEKLRIENGAAQINVSELKSGIYFLQVYEKGKLLAVQKVIKE